MTEATPDATLVAQIAQGEVEALAELFRRHRVAVFRFALHMTGSVSAAEDITQDVFLAAGDAARRYDPSRAEPAVWLCGIARNLTRKRLFKDRWSRAAPPEWPEPIASDDPGEALLRAERIGEIRRAVLALPPRFREVLVLCDMHELSYADAAQALDCALGTVRSRLHRARARLAIALGDEKASAPPLIRRSRCLT